MTKLGDWPDGPWDDEPDDATWLLQGYPCEARRHPFSGTWCGYLRVEQGHPWYGVSYFGVPADVHGGLSYSAVHRSGGWELGFDCNHPNCDIAPATPVHAGLSGLLTYKDLRYVRGQLDDLAAQAAAARDEALLRAQLVDLPLVDAALDQLGRLVDLP